MLWIKQCWPAAVVPLHGAAVPTRPCRPAPGFPISFARPAQPLQTPGVVRQMSTLKSHIRTLRGARWSPPVYRCRNKVKETVTCPRPHRQQVSELGFDSKPTSPQGQLSLLLAELPSQAHRRNGNLQTQTGEENQCQSLTHRQEYKKRGCFCGSWVSQTHLQLLF